MKQVKRFIISLDLGSESTSAYFFDRLGSTQNGIAKRIDLQFYAEAFAEEPNFLKAEGKILARLRSRYAVNTHFEVDEAMVPATPVMATSQQPQPIQNVEWLPKSHATQALIDYSSYRNAKRQNAGNKLTGYLMPNSSCFFKFVDDMKGLFLMGTTLPNAKLIFQANIGFEERMVVPIKNAAGQIRLERLEPVEIIKNEICLILENFVRNSDELITAAGTAPLWEQCEVVLTVPNIYTPMQTAVLKRLVGETLECEVHILTESDAIAFYYLEAVKPDSGVTGENVSTIDNQFLTIDIGKGTTDLTLLGISYQVPSETERIARGLEENILVHHVTIKARTGKPSGGAQMTFYIAQFLERLIDDAMKSVTSHEKGSPFRLCSETSSVTPILSTALTSIMPYFETVCENHKKGLKIEENRLTFSDLGITEEVKHIAEFLTEQASDYCTALSIQGNKRPLDQQTKDQMQKNISDILRNPGSLQPDELPQPEPWSQLRVDIRDYVRENTAKVLIELAVAHASGQSSAPDFSKVLTELAAAHASGKSSTHDFSTEAAQALKWMIGEKGAQGIRTHVIVAGQGAQFQPLKEKLARIFHEANLGSIHTEEEVKHGMMNELVKKSTHSREPMWGRIKTSFSKLTGRGDASRVSPIDHLAVYLSSDNLKDGCAIGAIAWRTSAPIMVNPHYIFGQLAFENLDGSEAKWADMDVLNSTREYKVRFNTAASRIIYFLPYRHKRNDGDSPQGFDAKEIGRISHQASEITVRIGNPGRDSRQLLITSGGYPCTFRDTIWGADGKKELSGLLWPTILPPAE